MHGMSYLLFLPLLAGAAFLVRLNAKRGLMGGDGAVLVGAAFGSGEKQYQPNNGTNRDKAESHQQYRVHKYSLTKMYNASKKPAIQQSSAMIVRQPRKFKAAFAFFFGLPVFLFAITNSMLIRLFSYVKRSIQGYFLAFLAGSGFAFGGRPILTPLIFSSVSAGYTACLERGFIPALCIRASTVLKGSFNFSHISSIVKPFISLLSVILSENIKKCKKFHAITIQKLRKFPTYIDKYAGIFL
jgi:hypothetical protein